MKRQTFLRIVTTAALLCAGTCLLPAEAGAQTIDFGQIDTFESLGTGTQRGGAPPKALVDDGERHLVFITILEADGETKVSWRSLDGEPRTTIIPGRGAQAFQTEGEFRLEALGGENRIVKYGYMLFRLKK
jgi:hypothetical protein